jgi:hypothetical protein
MHENSSLGAQHPAMSGSSSKMMQQNARRMGVVRTNGA